MHHSLARPKRLSTAICLTLAIAPLGASIAQDSDSDASDQKRSTVEEVMVTATRRTATDIQTTPVSVTSIGASDIDALVPRNLGDIATFVPNFSAAKVTGFNAASFAMRGVGQTDIIVYLDPPVGVTVDDFVVPHVQGQLLDVFDIERVEVLRGPQGTLFGKNTTGGVVNVVTKRPNLAQGSGEARLKFGSFGRKEVRAALDVPLIENELGFRFAGIYTESDGFMENGAEYGPVTSFVEIPGVSGSTGRGDRSDVGGEDVVAGRFKLRWEPTSQFSAQFQYEIIRDDSDTPATVNETPVGDPRFVWNLLGLTQDSGDPLDNAAVTNRDDLLLRMSEGHRVDVDGFYLNLDYYFGDYQFSSVTGSRDQESRLPSTYTGEVGPVSLFDATRDDNRDTFQQEFRIASNKPGPFNFVAGLFYQENDVDFCVLQVLGFLDLLGLGAANFGDPLFFDNNPQVLCNQQDAEATALFGDITYDVNDRFQISVGARYTDEEKSWSGRQQVFFQSLEGGFDPNLTWQSFNEPLEAGDFGRFPFGVVTDEESWEEPTWRVSASYQFNPDLYGYFTASRGFKSGGYNDQTGTTGLPITDRQKAPYDPEFADSFEFGLKSDLLGGRLRLNGTAFFVNYEDAQRGLVATLTNEFGQEFQETRFFNAAEIDVQGLEFEATAALSDDLTLRANLGYLDGEYEKFEADTDFDGDIDVDFSGRPITRAPEYQFSVDLTYDQYLAGGGQIVWNGNVYYEDDNVFIYSDVDSDFDTMLESRTLVNASATYFAPNDRYFVRVYGRNLADETYRLAAQPVANLWTFALYGAPRNYGVEVGFNFDF